MPSFSKASSQMERVKVFLSQKTLSYFRNHRFHPDTFRENCNINNRRKTLPKCLFCQIDTAVWCCLTHWDRTQRQFHLFWWHGYHSLPLSSHSAFKKALALCTYYIQGYCQRLKEKYDCNNNSCHLRHPKTINIFCMHHSYLKKLPCKFFLARIYLKMTWRELAGIIRDDGSPG